MHVVLILQIVVTIPIQFATAGVGAIEQLHEPYAILDQPAGEDAIFCEAGLGRIAGIVGAVALEDMRRLGAEIADLWHAQLHAGSEFVASDARRELAIAGVVLQVAGVHPL